MAKLFDKTKGSSLGSGKIMPPGSLLDQALLGTLARYRRSVASSYSPIGLDDLSSVFAAAGKGEVFLSEKLDGELWFLVLQDKEAFLANSRGRVIHGKLPFLTKAQGIAKKTGDQLAIFAGEFYATSAAGKDRPRAADLSAALAGGKGKVDHLYFAVFDIVELIAQGRNPKWHRDPVDHARSRKRRIRIGHEPGVDPHQRARALNMGNPADVDPDKLGRAAPDIDNQELFGPG